ncbi:MAG: 3'(2'),5'-bisphosphate nucleotidase CysQ [Hyphomicrobium sp.]
MTISIVSERDRIARELAEIASRAGALIMEVYAEGGDARAKADGSPVTIADERAEALIVGELQKRFPAIPIIAEEAAARGEMAAIGDGNFFLVDPLDGTKEFLNRNGEFTVNIALIEKRMPVAGVVYAPALEKIYFGGTSAKVADLAPGKPLAGTQGQTIYARHETTVLTAVVSRSHADPATEEFLSKLSIVDRRNVGSSLKFCLVATGEADVYPRLAPTMEWDTAAGHAVLLAAGGRVVCLDDEPLVYAKVCKGFRNPSLIAWGG